MLLNTGLTAEASVLTVLYTFNTVAATADAFISISHHMF